MQKQLPQKQLPQKYYLDHFNEFVAFTSKHNLHLLDDEHKVLLAQIARLAEDEQCLIVRLLNRKSSFIAYSSIKCEEINDIEQSLAGLFKQSMVTSVDAALFTPWLEIITKPELISLCELSEVDNKPPRSAKKSLWLDFARVHLSYADVAHHDVLNSYLYVSIAAQFEYFLFLFFNRLESNLSHFSMRDLGVMKTHGQVNGTSYFDNKQHALHAYHYAKQGQQLKSINASQSIAMAEMLLSQSQDIELGEHALLRKEKVLYKLACMLEKSHPELALSLLERCQSAKGQEKLARLLYSLGEIERCKLLLETILATPNDEQLLLFAKDFLLRKYGQKRTSILTDLLRENDHLIAIDEAYKGNTEQGVIAYYANGGLQAWHTENQLWLALFSLVFWQEIYENKLSMPSNEFERYPQLLKLNRFYEVLGPEIEQKLAYISQLSDLSKWLLKQAAFSFGKPGLLFIWCDALLEQLQVLVKHSSMTAITKLLRSMSKDFHNLKDGYPDLMVLERNTLRFEEIKAPGDALRRNQLVSINRLTDCGFAVRVQRTIWQFDPNQTYVVVDLETTGGKKETDRITEVGLVKVQQGKIVSKWQSLVNPQRHIPKYITQLTGIDNAMVATAPRFSEIAQTVSEFCENAIFVAHNVNFDMGFLKQEFQRLNIAFSKPKLCTVQLARKYLPGYSSYSLGNLCTALNIELHQHHRALDDALAAAKILLLINDVRAREQVVN